MFERLKPSPTCFGDYSRISPQARAENDCRHCVFLSVCVAGEGQQWSERIEVDDA